MNDPFTWRDQKTPNMSDGFKVVLGANPCLDGCNGKPMQHFPFLGPPRHIQYLKFGVQPMTRELWPFENCNVPYCRPPEKTRNMSSSDELSLTPTGENQAYGFWKKSVRQGHNKHIALRTSRATAAFPFVGIRASVMVRTKTREMRPMDHLKASSWFPSEVSIRMF